jgi:hypothetical protein
MCLESSLISLKRSPYPGYEVHWFRLLACLYISMSARINVGTSQAVRFLLWKILRFTFRDLEFWVLFLDVVLCNVCWSMLTMLFFLSSQLWLISLCATSSWDIWIGYRTLHKLREVIIGGVEQLVASILRCQISHFPCKYLGSQLSVRQLTREWQPILESILNNKPYSWLAKGTGAEEGKPS